MRYGFSIWALLVIMACALLSCTEEYPRDSDTPEKYATIGVTARSALYPANPEEKISGFRIMAFDAMANNIRSNTYYPENELTEVIAHRIRTGTYNFVCIANEPQDGIVNVALNNVNVISDLNRIQLPASSFKEGIDIPMINTTEHVKVLTGTAGVSIDGGTARPVWNISMQRLAVRFDMTLYSKSGSVSDFMGIAFSNLPDYVPLTGCYSGTYTSSRNYTVPVNPERFQISSVEGAAWAIKIENIILPSHSFLPADQLNRALVCQVKLGNGAATPQCILGIDEPNHDYTLPANTQFIVRGRVDYPIEVNIAASDWGMVGVDGSIYEKRRLSLSTLSASVNERNNTRVYFYSNQSNIMVEDNGVNGLGQSFVVNSVFPGITGASATNFHYTSGTSAGYFDLYTLTAPTEGPYKIYVNAEGLRREILINTSVRMLPVWSSKKFAGTFHRWNQTGERLITASNTGAWVATVEYPTGQSPFVALSSTRSMDHLVNTATPGNAEDFQVIDGGSSASGVGQIYFRVGLTSKLASATSSPRYARIKVTTGTQQVDYVYVRQGEAPDYVMRPTDPINSGGFISATRPLARKFSPFNLTDPKKGTGKVDRGTNGYVFTDYPTQTGYYFQWGYTAAWYPTGAGVNWNSNSIPGFWADNSSWETCPLGYHRPKDGYTQYYNTVSNTSPSISEMRQSLWVGPTTGSVQENTNSVTGYYADGYFDRRAVGTSGTGTTDSTVGEGVDIAFQGQLLFNPNTLASLFFPYSGFRDLDGALTTTGSVSHNWASSASRLSGMTVYLIDGQASLSELPNAFGAPIRCVKDE